MEGVSAARWIGGSLCLYFSCVLASSAGVGGGGLNLPILLVVFGFDIKVAVVYSLMTVLGNHISQTYLNILRPHPNMRSRPLIYWELILIMIPAQLFGTNAAVIFSSVLPSSILLIVAMLILLFASFKSIQKGLYLYALETERTRDELKSTLERRDTPLIQAVDRHSTQQQGYSTTQSTLQQSDTHVVLLESTNVSCFGALRFDWHVLCLLMLVWLYFAALYAVLTFVVTKCSVAYFAIFAASLVPVVVLEVYTGRFLGLAQESGEKPTLDGDLRFHDSAASVFLPPLAFVIGFLCALIGLGSAELTAPILLLLKVMATCTSTVYITLCRIILIITFHGRYSQRSAPRPHL
jgi:uncharacterized membrane protein YfcA